jgi:hypothetical protein
MIPTRAGRSRAEVWGARADNVIGSRNRNQKGRQTSSRVPTVSGKWCHARERLLSRHPRFVPSRVARARSRGLGDRDAARAGGCLPVQRVERSGRDGLRVPAAQFGALGNEPRREGSRFDVSERGGRAPELRRGVTGETPRGLRCDPPGGGNQPRELHHGRRRAVPPVVLQEHGRGLGRGAAAGVVRVDLVQRGDDGQSRGRGFHSRLERRSRVVVRGAHGVDSGQERQEAQCGGDLAPADRVPGRLRQHPRRRRVAVRGQRLASRFRTQQRRRVSGRHTRRHAPDRRRRRRRRRKRRA